MAAHIARTRSLLVLAATLALALTAVTLCLRLTRGWAAAPTGTESLAAGQPSVDRLDPDLREALWQAAAAAQRDGHELVLNSGWRSPEHQARLQADAVQTYGSVRAASRFVASPERSPHVQGTAVDVGPPSAAAWLDRNGSRFGLCRTFANEGWHFELATTPGGTCPALLPDASTLS